MRNKQKKRAGNQKYQLYVVGKSSEELAENNYTANRITFRSWDNVRNIDSAELIH